MNSSFRLIRCLRLPARKASAAFLASLLAVFCASCYSSKAASTAKALSSPAPPSPRPLAARSQQKLIEYQVAANAVRRDQECRETIQRERSVIMEKGDNAAAQEEFIKKWGLQKFDPNASFDQALAACVGRQKLTDLDIQPNETPASFLERKRKEWEEAKAAEAAARSRLK